MTTSDAALYQELRHLAVSVAREAGELVAKRRAEGVNVAATKSTPTDVVTAADQESERLIEDRLLAARPHDGIVGEEGASLAGDSGVTWVVDPIDGTVNYLYNIPNYAVSIAAEIAGRTVAGAVVNPSNGEMFSAALGQGATLDGKPITVSGATALEQSLVGTGFGYDVNRRAAQAAVLNQVIVKVRDIRRAGAAALDLCSVACGRLDAYYERGPKPWDFAAGGLIVAEAGGRIGGLHGAPPSDQLVISAAPAIFDALHNMLASAGADQG